MIYGYDDLLSDLAKVRGVFSYGESVFSRKLLAVIVGDGAPKTLVHGGIHARECVTSKIVVEMLKNYKGRAVCFVPMVNPDGAMLVKYGSSSSPENRREYLENVNRGKDFSLWKANGRAVDLNVNFDADFGTGAKNVTFPSPENYIGPFPFSEPESHSLKVLTEKYQFTSSISLHTKGEIVYYGFRRCQNYKKYAKMVAKELGFPLEKSANSAGGYKDWFLSQGYGFGVTLELGNDCLTHPIGVEKWEVLTKGVSEAVKVAVTAGEEIYGRKIYASRN